MKPSLILPLATALALGIAACSKPSGESSSGGAGGGSAGPADGVPLNTELPSELSVGTPKDLSKTPNLDPNKKPTPIMVPKDSAVVSKEKAVTSSDKEEPFEGDLAMITDGEKDGNEGYSVILSEGPQWVQIDLGESHLVDAVVLWHYFKNDRVVNGVVVQVSDDAEFKTGVTTIFNNDVGNTCGQGAGSDKAFIGTYMGKQISGNGAKGRYVRAWSNGSTDNKMNEYIEVEVWGRPAK
jgi:hypothetical protein